MKTSLMKSLLLLTLLSTILAPKSFSIDNDVVIEISIIGENERIRFNHPTLVAGIWHFMNISIVDFDAEEISLVFFSGQIKPQAVNRDDTNYYEWLYTTSNQTWEDKRTYDGYSYINPENCKGSGNLYSFCIGIKDKFPTDIDYYENWTLEVYQDKNIVSNTTVVVEKPKAALARSHAGLIYFNIEPFTEMESDGSDYFILENTGNIPLNLNIEFNKFQETIVTSNFSTRKSPYVRTRHDLSINSEQWKPGFIEISGSITATVPSLYIITTTVITFETAIEISAPDLRIIVGHSNFEIKEVGETNIVFQYEKDIQMAEDEIKDIVVYISGNGLVTLDIWCDEKNIDILSVSHENQRETPLTISSTNESETAVTIKVKALRENKIGFLNYSLETEDKTEIFTTQITISAPISNMDTFMLDIPYTAVIVIICILLVVIYMVFSYIKHKRR